MESESRRMRRVSKNKEDMKRNMKAAFDLMIDNCGGLDYFIDFWIDNEVKSSNALALDFIAHFYELTDEQKEKINAQVIVTTLNGEYNGDISEYI